MKIFSFDHLISTIFVFLILIFLPIFFNLDFLDPIQNTVEDFYVTDIVFSKIRNYDDVPKDTNIVIVNISNLNRKGIAKQIEIINQYEPLVIGLDSFFRSKKGDDQDIPLMEAFANTDKLILVSDLKETDSENDGFDSLHTSHKMLNKYAETGFANFVIKKGDFRTVRTFSPKEIIHDSIEFSFPLRLTKEFYPEKTFDFISRNKDVEIINFRRNIDKYITIDAMEIFKKRDSLWFIKGKIVLMGFMGPKIGDLVKEDIFYTPMNKQFVGKSYPDMYGVVVHANIISMISEENYLRTVPFWFNVALTFLIVYILMCIFTLIRTKFPDWYEPVSIIIIFATLIIVFLLVIGMFYFFNTELKLREALFAITLSGMAYEGYLDSIKPLTISFFKNIMK